MTNTPHKQRRAISYVRFSSRNQASGDSLTRQLDATRRYCESVGLFLDESVTLRDLGVSAWRGKNAKRGALAQLLDLADAGKLEGVSALVVESIDRLSRQDPFDAFALLKHLLDRGLELHFTSTRSVMVPGKVEPGSLFMAIGGAIRAHEESQLKSERLREAFGRKWERACNEGAPFAKSGPWWLRWTPQRWEPIPERVAVLKEIFELVAKGYTTTDVARLLNKRKVPPFNAVRSKRWLTNRIRDLIRSDAPLGTLAATKKTRLVGRDRHISGHYPTVLKEALVAEARAMVATRRRGTHGPTSGQRRAQTMFPGLLRHAGQFARFGAVRNGPTDKAGLKGWRNYYQFMTPEEIAPRKLLLNVNADLLEKMLLAALVELEPADVLNTPAASKVSRAVQLRAELAKIDATLQNLVQAAKFAPNVRAIAEEANRTQAQRDSLADELATAESEERMVKHELPKRELKAVLAGLHDLDLRDRAAAAIRRIVERIEIAEDVVSLPMEYEQARAFLDAEEEGRIKEIESPSIAGRVKPLAALVTFRGGAQRLIARVEGKECILSARVERQEIEARKLSWDSKKPKRA